MKEFVKKILEKYTYILRHFCSPEKTSYKVFFRRVGYYPNLNNPKTFNEKIQWLKLNNKHPKLINYVDKAEVKNYVSMKIGAKYIVPTLGIWTNVKDINFETLPNKFVLKCTHDSGGVIICKDKSTVDINKIKRRLKKHLQTNYYYLGFEWPYKNVKPRIIAEPYLEDLEVKEIRDYKFYVFNGKARIMKLATDRNVYTGDVNMDFYDMQFNHLPFTRGHNNSTKVLNKPYNFELMRDLAEQLAPHETPFSRIDFFEINKQVYFGEITFYPAGGWVAFDPPEWDTILGNMLNLEINTLNKF